MNLLFVNELDILKPEIEEFLSADKYELFFADSIEGLVKVMNNNKIDIIYLNIRNLYDLNLLNYIFKNYTEKLYLNVNKNISPAFQAIKSGDYEMVEGDMSLNKLKKILN